MGSIPDNGIVPDPDPPNPSKQFNHWHAHLPLSTILTLCDSVGPTIEKLCIEKSLTDDREILKYLDNGTLVGILPPPHPIYVRRFWWGENVKVWFAGFLWGGVFLKSVGVGEGQRWVLPVWTGECFRTESF